MERPAGRLARTGVIERIVLASDGGVASAAALRWVIDRVGYGSAEVEVVDTVDPDAADAAGRHAGVEGMIGLLGLFAPLVHLTARPAASDLLDLLGGSADSLLVLGIHRHDHRGLKVAELALTRTRGPVVVVPAEWIPRQGAVVVGVGAEDDVTSTLAFAAGVAAERRTEVQLIHAWQTTGTGEIPPEWDFGTDSIPERQQRALAHLARVVRESHPELTVTAEAVQGGVVARLSDAARSASLLVVGRSHQRAIARAMFSSTARGLLAELPCPVAVVP